MYLHPHSIHITLAKTFILHTYINVYISYIDIYVCVYLHVYIYTYRHPDDDQREVIYMYTCMFIDVNLNMYACIHLIICIHTKYIHLCLYV